MNAGYYDGVSVSTSIPDVGKVYYTHHIHSTSSTSQTRIDESPSSGAAYGEEVSDTMGGCFTKKEVIEVHYITLTEVYGEGTPGWYGMGGTCGYCGYHSVNDATSLGGRPITIECPRCKKVGYRASCGHVAGQVLKAEIIY